MKQPCNSSAPLPISVLLPTRNCMALLPAHVSSMQQWLHLVSEVVMVDSHSTDGTADYVRRELKHPTLRVLDHPPGLYQSWNFGIANCRSKYLYVSTVGDAITAEGLLALYETAEQLGCDLVTTPPRLIDTAGKPVDQKWPIHGFIDLTGITKPMVLSSAATFVFSTINIRQAIIGSSAGNLYRTEVLQRWPFPTDFGTAGDQGWTLRHAPALRFGILPQPLSAFVFHEKAYSANDYFVEDFDSRCVAAIRTALQDEPGQAVAKHSPAAITLIEELVAAWEAFLSNRRMLREKRKRGPLWALFPSAWPAILKRSPARRRVVAAQVAALRYVVTPFAEANGLRLKRTDRWSIHHPDRLLAAEPANRGQA